jgi:hypothetical protein
MHMQNQTRKMCLMMMLTSTAWVSTPACTGSVAGGQSAAQAVSTSELLRRYTQALDATQSFTDTYDEVVDHSYSKVVDVEELRTRMKT